jgi:hypothetical protein
MNAEKQKFLTIEETAKILKLSRVSVSNKISKKQIPCVHMSGKRGRALIPASYFENLEADALKAVQ